MTYSVAVGHTDIMFEASSDETILDAAERAGYALPYSCRKGVCSSCESGLRDGSVTVGPREIKAPSRVLLCRAKPVTNVTILPHRIGRLHASARKTIETTVFRLRWVTSDVALLLLRFPVSVRARFKAGQFLRIATPDGGARNYSMTNAPGESDGARLHIRYLKGGMFSETVLSTLQQGDKLTIEIPFGDFHLRDDTDRPIVCIATGVGFAPIASIIESLIERGSTRTVRVYWSGRDPDDLYLRTTIDKWARDNPWLTFVPHLAAGRGIERKLVHEEVLRNIPDLSGWQVYASGNPLMVRKARGLFTETAGLPEDQFFGEPFVTTMDEPAKPGQ